jgi:hypothetical protein
MGASLGISVINIYAFSSDFLKLFPIIDMLLILLEFLELGALSSNMKLRYGLYALKVIGSGAVSGINFFLSTMMIKKKVTSFKDFMRITIALYIWFDVGILVGMLLQNLPKEVLYLPLTTLCSVLRLLYVKFHPKW